MKLIAWFRQRTPKQWILLILLVIIVIFCISICLPFFHYFYMNNDGSQRLKIIHGYESEFAILYALCFGLMAMAVATFRKTIVLVVAILASIGALFTRFMIAMASTWWGVSPWHPEDQFGQTLCELSIGLMITLSFSSMHRFNAIQQAKWLVYTLLSLVILLPASLLTYVIITMRMEANAPHMMGMLQKGSKEAVSRKCESWHWGGENINYYNYFSEDTAATRLRPDTMIYILDSIQVEFLADDGTILKRLTKPSSNGKLDVKEFIAHH